MEQMGKLPREWEGRQERRGDVRRECSPLEVRFLP